MAPSWVFITILLQGGLHVGESFTLSPFHCRLVERGTDVPLDKLHYVVSLSNPSISPEAPRTDLEFAYIQCRDGPQNLRLITSKLPGDLTLRDISIERAVERGGTTIMKKKEKKKSRSTIGVKPKGGFGKAMGRQQSAASSALNIDPGFRLSPCADTSILKNWLRGQPGAEVEGCEALVVLRLDSSQVVGRGLYATKGVSAGGRILSIPEVLCLRAPKQMQEGLSDLPPDLALAVHLVQLKATLDTLTDSADKKSGEQIFLSTLPSSEELEGCGPYWTPNDCEELESPVLEAELLWRRAELHACFAEMDGSDLETLQWALACIRSRALGGGNGDGPVLVPLLDMANHAVRFSLKLKIVK